MITDKKIKDLKVEKREAKRMQIKTELDIKLVFTGTVPKDKLEKAKKMDFKRLVKESLEDLKSMISPGREYENIEITQEDFNICVKVTTTKGKEKLYKHSLKLSED